MLFLNKFEEDLELAASLNDEEFNSFIDEMFEEEIDTAHLMILQDQAY